MALCIPNVTAGGSGASAAVPAPHTGTTIVACRFKGGVVLGADSRVSTGTYISNRASNKIAPLSDHVYLLRSGSAADTQVISDHGTGGGAAARHPTDLAWYRPGCVPTTRGFTSSHHLESQMR
jgi:hypothetical protein